MSILIIHCYGHHEGGLYPHDGQQNGGCSTTCDMWLWFDTSSSIYGLSPRDGEQWFWFSKADNVSYAEYIVPSTYP